MTPARTGADFAASAAVLGALLLLGGVIVWHVNNPEPTPEAPAAAAVPGPSAAPADSPSARADYREIAGWHLFGTLDAGATTPATANDETIAVESMDALPESSMRLRVTGTVAASAEKSARAIIMDDGGAQREYAVGDRLPGNVELYAVEPDRIVIRRNGALEAIALPREKELIERLKRPGRPQTDRASLLIDDSKLAAHDER